MMRMGWFRRRGRTVLIHEYVTGGGLAGQDLPDSWATEGHALRRAAAEDFAAVRGTRVVMTLDDRFPKEPGPWEIVRVGPAEERAVLEERSAAANATLLIAPETDALLFLRAGWVREAGGRPLVSLPEALHTTASKFGLADILLSAGIRTPPVRFGWPPYLEAIEQARLLNRRMIRKEEVLDPAWGDWRRESGGREIYPGIIAGTEAEEALLRRSDWATLAAPRFPVVIKPIDGAGTVDTHLIADPDALAAALARREPDAAAKARYLDESDDGPCPSHYWIGLARLGAVLVQPFVPGEPMSASFLVDDRGRAHLVGVGRQVVETHDSQFRYHGGTVPAGTPELAAEARRAVEAVPGLRGWIGVDFLHEPDGRVAILEINPRLTTSFVGLRRLLPPGTLARAMLDAFERPSRLDRLDLAARVHARSPLTFRADGSILRAGS